MDPDANLKEQLELAQEIQDELGSEDETAKAQYVYQQLPAQAARLAELIWAMDDWIDNGGYLPKCWQKEQHGKRAEGDCP